MGLSCECGDWDFEWWYEAANDFSQLDTKRCRRCSSCKSKIAVGATVLKFFIYRHPTEWEYQTLGWLEGDEVPKAPKYLC